MRPTQLVLAFALAVGLGGASARVESSAPAFRPHHEPLPEAISGVEKQLSSKPIDRPIAQETALAVRGGVENTLGNAVAGAVAMALMEKGVKEGFKAKGITFPAQLGACLILFVSLLLTEAVNPGLAESIFVALSPGAAFLTKWLPVFFVPGLAMLPLAPPIGSGVEVSQRFSRLPTW